MTHSRLGTLSIAIHSVSNTYKPIGSQPPRRLRGLVRGNLKLAEYSLFSKPPVPNLVCRVLVQVYVSGALSGPGIGPIHAFRGVFACTGPAGGPVQTLRYVFACMGPANRPVQALRYVFAWMCPADGPEQVLRCVFACIGPANGSEQAITYGSGNRTNLTCTGNRFQNGAFVYKSRRFGRNPPDFQKI